MIIAALDSVLQSSSFKLLYSRIRGRGPRLAAIGLRFTVNPVILSEQVIPFGRRRRSRRAVVWSRRSDVGHCRKP